MSYDLLFYAHKDRSVSRSEIEQYFSQVPNMQAHAPAQWVYENEDTGVYCSFDLNNPEDDEEEFDGFSSTGLAFNINFLRPQFFGAECFPLVDQMCQKLDLYVLNPQSGENPQKYAEGFLQDEWSKSNLGFVAHYFPESDVYFLEEEKSDEAWKYNLERSAIQDRLGDNYFVPKIFFIHPHGDRTVRTSCVWPDRIPIVLPKVDYVIIPKKVRKLFRTKTLNALVPHSSILTHIASYFSSEEGFNILHPNQAELIENQFNALPMTSEIQDFGEVISSDRFVNAGM